jgi:hypothetical protein
MPTFARTQKVEHAIGRDGRFVLRVTSPDVEVRGTDSDVARVLVDFEIRAPTDADADAVFEAVRFVEHRAEHVLEISEPKRGPQGIAALALASVFGNGPTHVDDVRVVAELPRHASLSYSGVGADLATVGLRGAQEYRTVSGDLVLTELGGTIALNSVSGDITLRANGSVSLRANTVSGDLSVIAPRLEEARIVTVSGDIELEGDLGRESTHRMETVSGDLSLGVVGGLTLEVRGLSSDVDVSLAHRSEGSRDRRRYVIGDGVSSLLFSSMSGDVTVRQARRIGPQQPRPPVPPRPVETPRPMGDDEQLEVLRALERGEIDVDEATRRLAGGGSGA